MRVWFRYKEARAAMLSERLSRRGRSLAMRGGLKARKERAEAAIDAHSVKNAGGRTASSYSAAARGILHNMSASSREQGRKSAAHGTRRAPPPSSSVSRDILEEGIASSSPRYEVSSGSPPSRAQGIRYRQQDHIQDHSSPATGRSPRADSKSREIRSDPAGSGSTKKSQVVSISQVSKAQLKATLLARKPSASPFLQNGPRKLKTAKVQMTST